MIFVDFVLLCMEYPSHVREDFTHTVLLHRVELKAFCLVNSSPLADWLQLLSHHRNVASVAKFYRYFHANCSSDVANCMPPLLLGSFTVAFRYINHPSLSRCHCQVHTNKDLDTIVLSLLGTPFHIRPFHDPILHCHCQVFTSVTPRYCHDQVGVHKSRNGWSTSPIG